MSGAPTSPRGLDELVGVVQGVQVGTADPAGPDAHERFAGPGHRIGHVVDTELAVPRDCRSHGMIRPTRMAIGAIAPGDWFPPRRGLRP